MRLALTSTGGAAAVGSLDPSPSSRGVTGAPESSASTASSGPGPMAAGSAPSASMWSSGGDRSTDSGAMSGAVRASGGGAEPAPGETAGAPPEDAAGAPTGGADRIPPSTEVSGSRPRRKSRPPGLTRASSGGPGWPRRSICEPRSSWKRLTTSVKLKASPGSSNSRLPLAEWLQMFWSHPQ